MHPSVSQQLAQFAPISLDEMERVKLMDRTDTKFIFPSSQLVGVLKDLAADYFSLEVAGTRASRYETLYYDTDALDLYHRHHAGRASRWKVRARRYVESGICFLEVKRKNNKGRTIKTRVRTDSIQDVLPPEAMDLLRDITHVDAAQLKPKMWVGYARITLVGKHSAERVTIDADLHFHMGSQKHDLSHLTIVEVKRDQNSSHSAVLDVLKARRIKPASISKYCLAIAATTAGIRSNNFKEKIRLIERLSHAA